jgi:predicted aspartyl protease
MKLADRCLSEVELSKIVGTIDRLRRPVIRLDTVVGDSFLALVDTGFNGQLMLSESDAQALGFVISRITIDAMLAGDVPQTVREGIGNIRWLGEDRKIDLVVSPTSKLRRKDDDPIALIGTRLLTPHLLLVDFATNVLEIERQT